MFLQESKVVDNLWDISGIFLFICYFLLVYTENFSIAFKKYIYLFSFGCTGSSLLCRGWLSIVTVTKGHTLLRCSSLKVYPCFYKWQDFIFLWIDNIPVYTHTHTHTQHIITSLYIHLSMDTLVVSISWPLCIMLNIVVHVSFLVSIFMFLRYFMLFLILPRNGIRRYYGSSVFNFWRTSLLFFIVATLIYVGEGNGTPLFPGKSHGWRSLVGCGPWGR